MRALEVVKHRVPLVPGLKFRINAGAEKEIRDFHLRFRYGAQRARLELPGICCGRGRRHREKRFADREWSAATKELPARNLSVHRHCISPTKAGIQIKKLSPL